MIKLYDGIIDLHNHSTFSDGDHSIEELIDNAVKVNIDVIGITDHYEKIEDLSGYIETLNKVISKHQKMIKIVKGVELKATTFFNLSTSDFLRINQLDYILIEDCEYYRSIYDFIEKAKMILPHIKVKVGIAHIDLKVVNHKYGLKGINAFMGFLENYKIFFEINSSFSNEFYDRLLYSNDNEVETLFSSIKNYSIEISIGSDTHMCTKEDHLRRLRANQFVDLLVKKASRS